MKPFALRWIGPAFLAFIFVILILNAGQQFQRARAEVEKTLEASLIIEGGERASWLSDRLDPFYYDWHTSPTEPVFHDLTNASWLLLDASGEVALSANGAALYARPVSASGELEWKEDQEAFDLALGGTIKVGPPRRSNGLYRMRVFLPVETASGSISTRWVLMGEATQGKATEGEATEGEENKSRLFDQLFNAQRQFWLTASPLAVAALLLLVLLFRSITRTNRLEAVLREAEESIEIESLTSTLAHELRNPLSIIQSCTEILRKQENLSEDGKELTEDILEEITRSQEVLMRHLHPERYLVTEIEDLPSFCNDFWEHRQALLQTHSITLELLVQDGQMVLGVYAVADQLEKILDNLLRNSIEAMPDGGVIRFSLERQADSVLIRFEDDGPGFGTIPFISREGWRFGHAKPGGKGIGLRLARKWVERWGGELNIRTLRASLFGKVKGTAIMICLRRLPQTIETGTDPSSSVNHTTVEQ